MRDPPGQNRGPKASVRAAGVWHRINQRRPRSAATGGMASTDIFSTLNLRTQLAGLANFFDACTCSRNSKAEVQAIRSELEKKDAAIEQLEEEIRRKDSEKDNLMQMQRDLQQQISQIRSAIEEQQSALETEQRPNGAPSRQYPPGRPADRFCCSPTRVHGHCWWYKRSARHRLRRRRRARFGGT